MRLPWGIPEYWLVDARQAPLRFDLLRLTDKGYVSTRKRAGWLPSRVFQLEFRLVTQTGEDGFPDFTLEVRDEPKR
jgi:Uma2 family endonuclease